MLNLLSSILHLINKFFILHSLSSLSLSLVLKMLVIQFNFWQLWVKDGNIGLRRKTEVLRTEYRRM